MKIKPTPPDPRTFPVLERYSRGAVSAADAAWEIQALNIPGCEADELLERQRDAHDRRTF